MIVETSATKSRTWRFLERSVLTVVVLLLAGLFAQVPSVLAQTTDAEDQEKTQAEAAATAEEDSADAEEAATFENTITITGSNIPQIEQETALPVSTISTEEIMQREAATSSELFSYIPQATALENQEGSTGPNDARGDASSVNLRGLGSNATLVLLNGRRLPPHPISSGAVPRLTVNVNTIPARALDRVEVLRDGASAIYGADAVAGVVNAIVKSGIDTRFQASARYGETTEGPMSEGTVSFAAGFQPNEGKTSLYFYTDAFDRDGLRGRDKWFAADGDLRERSGSESTSWDNRSVNTPNGRFRTGTANPDGSFTGIPAPGAPDDDFYMVDGGVNFGSLPRELRYNYAADRFLIPDTTRFNFYGKFEHQLRPSLTFFGDLSLYFADSLTASAAVAISGSSNNDIFVPSQNYYNPFQDDGLDVLIRNYRPVELGDREAEVESTSGRLLFGARGFWGFNWVWEAAATYGRAETTDLSSNMLSESKLRAQLALDTADAWNVFGVNSEEVMNQVRIRPRRDGTTSLGILDGKVTGLLTEMPAGPLYVSTGLEYRHETFDEYRDHYSNIDDVIALSQTSDTNGSRDVGAAFAEFSIPLLHDLPLVHHLELSVAGRFEHFSDFGSVTVPKVALSWHPTSWLLARGSYAEGFQAPNLAQLFTGEIPRRVEGVQDPYRVDVTASPADLGDVSREVIRGGNINLEPEESETMTVGLVFQSPKSNRLFISVDYWDIKQDQRIDTFGHEDQLNLDFLLRTTAQGFNPDVVRGAPTADDMAAFDAWNAANPGDQRQAVGEVLYVRDTYFNLSYRQVAGWDFGLAYDLPTNSAGQFSLKSEFTYYDQFDQQKSEEDPVEDQIRVNGNPEYRGNVGIMWNMKRVGAGLFGNYISDFVDTSAPAADGGDFIVESWTTYNAYVSYAFKNGMGIRLSANNLTDEAPPLADEIRNFYNQYHSPRGRMIYGTWTWSF